MNPLNNLTRFEDFKKLYEDFRKSYEAVDTGTEYSNKTGFSESLIGRATLGIFGLIKDGINAIRIEYFKRKLENEYLAGVLRYCKSKNIDLKDPQKPAVEDEENEMVRITNEILLIRFNDSTYVKDLTDITDLINTEISSLGGISGKTVDDYNLIITKLIPDIKIINDNFSALNVFITSKTVPPITDIPKIAEIKTKIEDIKTLVLTSPPTPVQLKYTLTNEEKTVISGLTSTPAVDPTVITSLNTILVENFNCNEYQMINESSIGFILGDEVSANGLDEYLKSKNINSWEEIKFDKLIPFWTDKYKDEATNGGAIIGVNKIGIIRIAANVQNIITESKSSTRKGTTKGEATKFMTPWTSKVLKIKEEFSSLLKVDDIDPLTMKGVQQYLSDPKNADKINKDGEQQKEIARITSMIKYGKPHGLTGSPFKDTGMLRILTRGNPFMGPVFKLEKGLVSTYKVYKYIGYLNLDKIVEGSETSLKLLVDNSTVLKFWESNKYGSIVPFLPKNKEKSPSGTDLAGIYFLINSITSPSSGDSKDIKIKIFYVYVSGARGNTIRSIPSFELYSLDDNNKLNVIDPTTKKLEDSDNYSLGLGGTYEIDSPTKDGFKTTITHIEPEFSTFVKFK